MPSQKMTSSKRRKTRQPMKSARKASRRKTTKSTPKKRRTQSAPMYKQTRNKVYITKRGAAKIKKNGKWKYVTPLLLTGAAAIGGGGYLWKRNVDREMEERKREDKIQQLLQEHNTDPISSDSELKDEPIPPELEDEPFPPELEEFLYQGLPHGFVLHRQMGQLVRSH